MEQSESIAALITAVNAVMGEIGYVQKGGKNQSQGYTFAGETDLLAALRPCMVAHGLCLIPVKVVERAKCEYPGKSGGLMHRTDLIMRYKLCHISGEYLHVETTGDGMDSGDKDAPKAMTIAFKYALRQSFAIETGDDPDKDHPEAAYMTPEERKELRSTVKKAAKPAPPREPASEVVKSVAQQKLAKVAAAVDATRQYGQPHFPGGKGKALGRFEMHATGKGATFTGPGPAGSVIMEVLIPALDKPNAPGRGTVVYYSAAKLRQYTGLDQPHTYTGVLEADCTKYEDGTVQLDSLSIPGAPSDELPPPISVEEITAEMANKGKD